jgi:histidine triad (HIT) family protein
MPPTLSADCVFCDIIRGTNPHQIVYEDPEFLGFLDRYPLNPGHTQVMPKNHCRWVWDMDRSDLGFLMVRAQRIAKALQVVFDTEWVIADTGGISVPHAHIHLVPRFEDDGHGELPDPKILREIPDQEMEDIAERIRTELERSSG